MKMRPLQKKKRMKRKKRRTRMRHKKSDIYVYNLFSFQKLIV